MPISMAQAERLICNHLVGGEEDAGALLKCQRIFFDFIAEGVLHPTAERGQVLAYRTYPADEQHPARILYDWDSPQEIWAASALIDILDEFDFDTGTMTTLPSDTASDTFPWPWRGGSFVAGVDVDGKAVMRREDVVISLEGVAVDRSELLRCISTWQEENAPPSPTPNSELDKPSAPSPRRPAGRPGARATVRAEMERRAAAHEMITSRLIDEAEHLSRWLEEKFPNEPNMRMKAKSISDIFGGHADGTKDRGLYFELCDKSAGLIAR
jgi:hypothetical protein